MKNEIKILDWLVFATFIFLLGTRLFTAFYISHITAVSGAEITAIATVYESNPVAKLFITATGIKFIMSYLIMPSAVIAVYLVLKKLYKKKKITVEALSFYVYLMFLIFLQNFLNDFVVLLGKLL